MHSAAEILVFLIGTSMGSFVLITLAVAIPGRGSRRPEGPVWIGGPRRSERGVSTSGMVLAERTGRAPGEDWVLAAETAEPGRHIGGASAGW
ncbi:hypothetical protein [Nonomuraea pusilla]|uniref:hypothetical protein n=1 Tax=Nonomuraea pusilla TaxID=46177 RepID=UPI0006E27CEC|nr:hypothetical protein [Nonomuraea pusilla]